MGDAVQPQEMLYHPRRLTFFELCDTVLLSVTVSKYLRSAGLCCLLEG